MNNTLTLTYCRLAIIKAILSCDYISTNVPNKLINCFLNLI